MRRNAGPDQYLDTHLRHTVSAHMEILGADGAGGKGGGVCARDTKLNRDVAIKVLPEVFALDADRLVRFTEAQTLAR